MLFGVGSNQNQNQNQNQRSNRNSRKSGALLKLLTLGVFTSLIAARNISPDDPLHKVSPWLLKKFQTLQAKSAFPVLVILKEQADLSGAEKLATKEEKGAFVYRALTEVARGSQTEIRSFLEGRGVKYRSFFIMNFLALYDANQTLVAELAARPDVARIIGNPSVPLMVPGLLQGAKLSDRRHFESLEAPAPTGVGENISAVNANKVWSDLGANGQGITVAGQDTGYEWQHPALKEHYRGYTKGSVNHDYHWHDAVHTNAGANKCGVNSVEPCDDNQHGTHTMGTMIGDDGGANKIGMAPGAKWIGCRNMDAGNGTPATYTECFEWFLAPWKTGDDPMKDGRPEFAPHVINNSWGCPTSEGCEGTEMKAVLTALQAAGIVVVVSAGNDGPSCQTVNAQPASHSNMVLSVGAANHRDWTIAGFSSRGPSAIDSGLNPHVAAPGVSVRSSIPGGSYAGSMWSGTSMAGPHVAGLVALVLSAQPKLIGHVPEVREIIESSSVGRKSTQSCGGFDGGQVPNAVFGHGTIDAFLAVTKAKAL